MKKIVMLFVCALFIPSAFATTTIKAEVNGMVCAFCAKGIEKKLNALPQGSQSMVDLKSRVVALQLKDGQSLSDPAFAQIIKDADYSVEHIERVNLTIGQIQQTLKARQPQEANNDSTLATATSCQAGQCL